MPPKLYNMLREEETLWPSVTTKRVREINTVVDGEFTFFDGSINRLQWERVERVYEYVTVSPPRPTRYGHDQYRRGHEVEWADGGLTCEHTFDNRYRELEEEFLKTFECFDHD